MTSQSCDPPTCSSFPHLCHPRCSAGQAHHGGLFRQLVEAGRCTLPRFLPWGWKLWKYQALTCKSTKENGGGGRGGKTTKQTITWSSSRSCQEEL